MFCYVVPNQLCHALQALVEALGTSSVMHCKRS